MKGPCPNINSKEWKELLKLVGKDEAWRQWHANGSSMPDIDAIKNKTAEKTGALKTEQELVEKAMQTLKKKADIINKKFGDNTKDTKIQGIIKTIERDYNKKKYQAALLTFINLAHEESTKIVGNSLDTLVDTLTSKTASKKEKKKAASKLSRGADYLSSFNLVTDIFDTLKGTEFNDTKLGEGIIDEHFRVKYIDKIQGNIDKTKRAYISYTKEFIADFLMEYNRDATLTKAELIRMLTTVDDDLSLAQWKLDSLAELPDQVLALVDRVVSTQRAKTNKAIVQFKNGEFKEKVEALEADAKANGRSVLNHEELYDFMLYKDADGTYTGKYKSDLPKVLIDKNGNAYKDNRRDAKEIAAYKTKHNLSDAQYNFLEMFHDQYTASQLSLPNGYRRGNQLIPILKSSSERAYQDVRGFNSAIEAVKGVAKDKFTVRADETDRAAEVFTDENGKEHKFIPIRYTTTIGNDKGQVPIKDISLDMQQNLLNFMTMARNRKSMMSVMTELEAIKAQIGERTVTSKTGVKELVDKVTGKKVKTKGEDSQAYKRLEDYFNMVLYGAYKLDEGGFLGTKLDQGKLADALAGYTSFNNLALNLYSGINNAAIGQLMNFIEAHGGQFYTKTDWRESQKLYVKHLPELLKDATEKFTTSDLGKWLEEYDIFQEFDEAGNHLDSSSRAKRYISKGAFILQSAGEHTIQTQLAISMATHHRVVKGQILSYQDYILAYNLPIDNKTKEDFEKNISVYDNLMGKKTVVSNKEMIQFTERIKGVYQRLHGNYAKKDKAAINQWGAGRLGILFRKWIRPGWNKNFAKATYDGRDNFDQRLGANIGGNYRITYNFLSQVMKDYEGFGISIASMKEAWNDPKVMPEWKKQAVRRTMAQMFFIAATMGLLQLMDALEFDDDNWLASMTIYQLHRIESEQLFYLSPASAMEILRSPSAVMSSTEKLGRVLAQFADPFEQYEKRGPGYEKGDYKIARYAAKATPLVGQITKWSTPEEYLSVFGK